MMGIPDRLQFEIVPKSYIRYAKNLPPLEDEVVKRLEPHTDIVLGELGHVQLHKDYSFSKPWVIIAAGPREFTIFDPAVLFTGWEVSMPSGEITFMDKIYFVSPPPVNISEKLEEWFNRHTAVTNSGPTEPPSDISGLTELINSKKIDVGD
jgi:hypothetical protein